MRLRTKEYKESHKKYQREVWYPKNRKRHIALVIKSRVKRYRIIKDMLNKIKSEKGCIDCGIKDFRVLDFDHLGNKEFSISQAMTSTSLKRILEEVKKCEVRCANCHRVKTWERKHNHSALKEKYEKIQGKFQKPMEGA